MHLSLPRFIAHRGASDICPENTMVAFKAAKDRGHTWVEFDVQLSADNIPVVFHDNILDRTSSGSGCIYEQPYEYLRALDAGSWFNSQFSHEPIPSLEETLQLLAQLGLHANIEIKDSPDLAQNRKTAAVVAEYLSQLPEAPARYLVSSFCIEALRVLRQKLPQQALGMLLELDHAEAWQRKRHYYCQEFESLNCYSLNVNHSVLTPALLSNMQLLSPRILAYTVNQRSRAQQLFDWGLTGVFSDGLV